MNPRETLPALSQRTEGWEQWEASKTAQNTTGLWLFFQFAITRQALGQGTPQSGNEFGRNSLGYGTVTVVSPRIMDCLSP